MKRRHIVVFILIIVMPLHAMKEAEAPKKIVSSEPREVHSLCYLAAKAVVEKCKDNSEYADYGIKNIPDLMQPAVCRDIRDLTGVSQRLLLNSFDEELPYTDTDLKIEYPVEIREDVDAVVISDTSKHIYFPCRSEEPLITVSWSSNKRTFAVGSELYRWWVYDVENHRVLLSLEDVEKAILSNAGDKIVVHPRMGKNYIVDLISGKKQLIGCSSPYHHVPYKLFWSPDDSKIFCLGCDFAADTFGKFTIVDSKTAVVINKFKRYPMCPSVAAWSPDGRHIAIGGTQGRLSRNGQVIAFSLEKGFESEVWKYEVCDTYPDHAWGTGFSWSPDGNFFLVQKRNNTAMLLDGATGTALKHFESHYIKSAWLRNGNIYLTQWPAAGGLIRSQRGMDDATRTVYTSLTPVQCLALMANRRDSEIYKNIPQCIRNLWEKS